MFGSDFDAHFGIPAFPFEGMDPAGGLFGANTGPAQIIGPGGTGQPQTQPPIADPGAATVPGEKTSGSPLGSPFAPGGGLGAGIAGAANPAAAQAKLDAESGTAPAAGVGSPFGKPQL